MKALALTMFFGLAAAAVAHAQKKDPVPGQGIDWQGNWDEAVKEATARNVPIMVTFHKDG